MITRDKIAEIRDRASLVEVISDYVTLKKVGRNYVGLCPFHDEKTPSFSVSDEKGIFHCFSCKAGGGVFDFLMQHEHLSFPDAVEAVAKRYGITVQRSTSQAHPREEQEREALYRVNERVAAHYHDILFHEPSGKKALAYLRQRGIEDNAARRFVLGFAPPHGSGLVEFLAKEKLSHSDASRLGLLGRREDNRLHEKFFARLMFPIADPRGKTIGFGGRVLDGGLPKYLNSSETPLFRKGSVVYGLFQAREGIRKADRIIVVEGYFDVIALHQHGIDYSVATLGTALTVDHLRGLSRYSQNIIALFDGDEAGSRAAARSFEIFLEAGLLGRAAFLPKGDDPDTFVRREGRQALEDLLDRSVPLADNYFAGLERRYGKSLEGKSRIAGEVSRVLQKVRNPFEVDLLVARAVDSLGIREEFLRQPRRDPAGRKPSAVVARPVAANGLGGRDDVAVRVLIGLVLRFPEIAQLVFDEKDISQWASPGGHELMKLVWADWREHGNIEVSRITHQAGTAHAASIAALAFDGEDITKAEAEKMATDCMVHLRRQYLRERERNLRIAIRTAEEQKDENAKRERILEWQDIVRKERQLERRRFASKTTTTR